MTPERVASIGRGALQRKLQRVSSRRERSARAEGSRFLKKHILFYNPLKTDYGGINGIL